MRTPGGSSGMPALLVVDGHPPGADAELEPAVGEQVERRGLVGDDDGVAVVVAEHAALPTRSVRRRLGRQRHRGDRCERVVDEVVGHVQRRVAERLGLAGGLAVRRSPTPRAAPHPEAELPCRVPRRPTLPARSSRREPADARPSAAGGAEAERVAGGRVEVVDLVPLDVTSTVAITSCAMRSPRAPCTGALGSVLTSSTFSSPRYCGSIRPGVFRHVTPCFEREPRPRQHQPRVARRDRDRDPVGTSARPPPARA